VLVVTGLAGEVVVPEHVDVLDAGLDPICSRTGEGKTSLPKMAGTPAARTCSMSSATSRGVGSSKSDTWIAPITSHP
jgi:hypothetical protein